MSTGLQEISLGTLEAPPRARSDEPAAAASGAACGSGSSHFSRSQFERGKLPLASSSNSACGIRSGTSLKHICAAGRQS